MAFEPHEEATMMRSIVFGVGLALLASLAAAETRCETVLRHLSRQLADAACVESADLTTTNSHTDARLAATGARRALQ